MIRKALCNLSLTVTVLAVAYGGATAAKNEGSMSGEVQPIRIGYLHSIQSDAHMWLGLIEGEFEKAGLNVVETTQFNTGISLAQALAGGSVDVGTMGAVISNFPARGQGTAFLANNIEAEGAQIWVSEDSGVENVADLRGKRVATTVGTTGHVMLHVALEDAGLSTEDVEVVNSDMPTAVNAFISGSVPALATWVPYDTQIRKQSPDAEILTSAAKYFPEAAIMGGWVASNEAYSSKKDMLVKFVTAWLNINKQLQTNTEASIEKVQAKAYQNFTPERVLEMFNQQRWYSNEEWAERYRDGTVAEWLGKVEQVFVDIGGLDSYVPPEEFFDPNIFLQAYEDYSK